MNEQVTENVAETGEKRLVQTFEDKAMADMERTDSGIFKDLVIAPVADAREAQEIAKSAGLPDADPLEGNRSLEPVPYHKQVGDPDSDEIDPDTLDKDEVAPPEAQGEIALVAARSPEAVEQARQKFKIPRYPQDDLEEAGSKKSKSIVYSDQPEMEEGFIGKEELRENVQKADNKPAGFEGDDIGMGGLGALGALGAGGLAGAGGPSGGFNGASGGKGGMEPGDGGDGGAFGWSFRQEWLRLRRPMEHRPLTKRLDKVIATILADDTRDTNVVYMNVGWRTKSNPISKTIVQFVDARARYLATHPDEASRALGLSQDSPTLMRLGQLQFTDSWQEADKLRQMYRARAAAAATPAPAGP